MSLGKALRAVRIHKGLSRRRASEMSATKPTWFSHVESGKRFPAWDTLDRICIALGEPMWKVILLASQDPQRPSEDFRKIVQVFPEMQTYFDNLSIPEPTLPPTKWVQPTLPGVE